MINESNDLFQLNSIWKNENGIESWIIKEAIFRRKTNNQINEFV
jgi:hypothetical protein